MLDLKKVITVTEASTIAGIDDGYIRRMLIAGKFKDLKRDIDYVKSGNAWLINRNSWEKHLQNVKKKNKPKDIIHDSEKVEEA